MKLSPKQRKACLALATTPGPVWLQGVPPGRCEVPIPPSVNHLWRCVRNHGRVRVVKSKHYREWLQVAVPLLATSLPQYYQAVAIEVTICRGKGWRKGRDLSNCFKAVEDAMVLARRLPGDSEQFVQVVTMRFGKNRDTAACVVAVSEV